MTAKIAGNPRIDTAITSHKSLAAYMGYVHGDKEAARAWHEWNHYHARRHRRISCPSWPMVSAKAEPNVQEMPKRTSR